MATKRREDRRAAKRKDGRDGRAKDGSGEARSNN